MWIIWDENDVVQDKSSRWANLSRGYTFPNCQEYEVVFYADIDNDGISEKLTYYLEKSQFKGYNIILFIFCHVLLKKCGSEKILIFLLANNK